MRYLTSFTICFLFCIYVPSVLAQKVSYLSTDKPEQGKKITIYYRTIAEAGLTEQDSIFAGVRYWDEEGTYHQKTIALIKTLDHTWSMDYRITKDAAYLSIRFYHLFKDDPDATIDQIIYHQGIPARGSSYQQMYGEKLHQQFHDEITRYPDNYFSYARYINALPADTVVAIANSLKSKLLTVKKIDEGHLAAMTVIYAKLGEKEKAYATILTLLEKYPSSSVSNFILSFYLYEQYKTSGSMRASGKLYDAMKNIFISFPKSPIAGGNNAIFTLSADSTIQTVSFERVLLHLYQTGRIDYNSLGILPNFYLKRNIKLNDAERLLKQAICRLTSGQIYHQYRLTPTYIHTYTADYLHLLAKVHLLQRRPTEAIIVLSAALQEVKGSSFEGGLKPLLEIELAEAYSRTGNNAIALEQYKKIYTGGNEKVKDSIAQLYVKLSTKVEFDKFIASTKDNKTSTGDFVQAPPFSGTDLSGKSINLSDYKGKIVVINAWFIGCAPCIAEMPDLNRLVTNYATQTDVVFLALTPDKTAELAKFLLQKEFKYTVVNNLKGIAAYDISMYPQHLIIDRKGNIVYRTSGSNPGMSEKLSEVIEKQKKL